jgi:hypothetical protein
VASSSGIRAGAAFIELSVNDSRLIKGLQAASRKLQSFGAGLRKLGMGMMAAGAGIVAPLLASAKSFASMGDQLDKMSKRTGIGVEALSELSYAAQLSGADLGSVENGVRRMQRTIADAADGTAMATDALARLGLSAEQLMALSPEEQFSVIAKRLNEISDPTLKAAAAMEILGRSGTALLPMMEEMAETRAEARKLGLVMSGEDAKAAAKLNDAMDRMRASLRFLTATVGSALAPLLTELADKVAELVGPLRKWLSENRGLVISALKIGTVILGVGVAFVALGSIVSALGTAFGVLASVVSTALGLILSPVGLVVAAIAGIGGAILWATDSGGKALAWLGGRFGFLKDFALDAFQGIKDALAAGDVMLAARILWLSLQVAWQAGIAKLKGYWIEFRHWYSSTAWELAAGALAVWEDIKVGASDAIFAIMEIWTLLTTSMAKTWNEVMGFLAKRWLDLKGIFGKDIDVAAGKAAVDRDVQSRNLSEDDRLRASIDASKQNYSERDRERRENQAMMGDMLNQELAQQQTDYAAALVDAQSQLDAAKDEWRAALAEAKAKRAAAETPEAARPSDIQDRLGAAAPELERALRADVVGTFTAEAADRMGLGPSAAEERTAKASEETARNTKLIARQLEDSAGLAFE